MPGRLTHADDAAAPVDKPPDGHGNRGVLPFASAGVGRVTVAHIEDDVNGIQNGRILPNILKGDKLHIKGSAGQRLDDAGIGIVLLLIQGMVHHMAAPGAHSAPAVQHRHSLHAVGSGAPDALIQQPELVAHRLDIVHEIRELQRQLQISAVANAVDGLAQDGSAGGDPVFPGFLHRVAPLVEGIREEIGQEPALGVPDAGDVGNQPQGGAVAHGAHHRVQPDGPPLVHEGLGANPVIAQEHHGFQSVFMGDVHHFPAQGGHLPALEGLEVLILFGGNPVLVVVVALIHDVFGTEPVAHLPLKFLQNIGRDGRGIAVPIHVFLPLQLIENQSELVEEGGEANHVHIGVLLNEFPQPLHGEIVGLGLANVKGELMLEVLPVVGHGVIHMHRVPDDVGQKRYSVLMVAFRFRNDHAAAFLIVVPALRLQRLPGGTIHHLPPALPVVPGVHLQ